MDNNNNNNTTTATQHYNTREPLPHVNNNNNNHRQQYSLEMINGVPKGNKLIILIKCYLNVRKLYCLHICSVFILLLYNDKRNFLFFYVIFIIAFVCLYMILYLYLYFIIRVLISESATLCSVFFLHNKIEQFLYEFALDLVKKTIFVAKFAVKNLFFPCDHVCKYSKMYGQIF